MKRFVFLAAMLLLAISIMNANNVRLGPATSTQSGNIINISFTLAWDNSWKVGASPANFDAVWVFAKARECTSPDWFPIGLSPAASSADLPLMIVPTSGTRGVMISRASLGSGNIGFTNITVRAGVINLYDFQLFAVEMVNIPSLGFTTVGDGASYGAFCEGPSAFTSPVPKNIGSGAITIGTGLSDL